MPDILNRRDDPISYKYFVMTRDLDESAVKDITPNKEEQEAINKIFEDPDFAQLNAKDKSMLWHFRYSLTTNKRALIKFLQCVEWTKDKEEVEAM